jgi:SPW repeat-containing protein
MRVEETRMAAAGKWRDWTSFTLGLWLAVSPWLAGYAEHEAATANAAFVGLALALASHFEATFDQLATEWLLLAVGLWLVMAPFVLGFTMQRVASTNSICVGALVAVLAFSALQLDKEIGKWWHKHVTGQ